MKFNHRTFRGDAPQLHSPMLDRRTSVRREVQTPGASLHWSSVFSHETTEARLVNLSRGGAGLLVRETPPPDAVLRLVLAGAHGAVVEGWPVAIREDEGGGWTFLHMKFSHGCPLAILERLLGVSGAELLDDEPLGSD